MRSAKSLPVILLSLLSIIFLVSCGNKNDVRSFKETIPENVRSDANTHGQGMNVPVIPSTEIKWDTPEGWTNIKTESKLRLATYSIKSGEKEAICTIIPLSGDAGGLKANIQMWLSSISGKDLSGNELEEFILKQKKFRTKSNNGGIFIDLTGMTDKGSDLSIIVSVIDLSDKTLFIKLSGDRDIVKSNLDKILSLSKSIVSGE